MSIGCGGTLRAPDPSRWIREHQLAEALFHRDHPVGTFTGQAPYLRQAHVTLTYGKEIAKRLAYGHTVVDLAQEFWVDEATITNIQED